MKSFFLLIAIMLAACTVCVSDSYVTRPAEKKIIAEEQKSSPTPTAVLKQSNTPTVAPTPAPTTVKAENTNASPLYKKVICVDAGHGINSSTRKEQVSPDSTETKRAFVSGTAGKNQTEEQLNLTLAVKLQKKLMSLGADVHMTRTTHETQMSNIDRAEFGNKLNADISVKIHADGGDSSLSGTSMLVPSGKSMKGDACIRSRRAGELVLNSVIASTGAKNRGVVERSDMTGFNWSRVPVILIEVGFMTNPSDDMLLESDEYCDKIVNGIADGLISYFSQE